jgi:hypothetical protein
VAEARSLLNDTVQTAGSSYRYSDADLVSFINAAIREIRAKRPDVFLGLGLRYASPIYSQNDFALAWPLDESMYDAALYYTVGRAELREDTFTDDGRAQTLMTKFVNQIIKVES